jgi:hypothetical protein
LIYVFRMAVALRSLLGGVPLWQHNDSANCFSQTPKQGGNTIDQSVIK